MEDQLRVGIIGLGILGSNYATFLHKHPATRLIAVSDIRSNAAEKVAEQVAAVPYANYKKMLDQHRLDLVIIATPDHLHTEPTLAAIAAGVPNIIQEKPLATQLAEAEAICTAVERAGTRFFINFANRAMPLDIATRYVLREGLLGQPVYGESRLEDNICVPTQMWGDRTREWTAGSSPAHFLLSHVIDLLRWFFAPAEVTEVYAVSQRQVLGHTPDLYDAFLTFDSGLKVRVKAEWIKHIDELVEFEMCFSGSEGTLIYHKRPGFGTQESWRANLARNLTAEQLMQHRATLQARGISLRALIHHPQPLTGVEAPMALGLEHLGSSESSGMGLVGPIIDAIKEGVSEPSSWQGNGALPNHIDGLRQVYIVQAIVDSSNTARPIAPQK